MPDDTAAATAPDADAPSPSRRRFLGRALGAAGVVAAGGAGFGVARATDADADTGADTRPSPGTQVVPFYARTQAGIATPAQDRLAFAAFDIAAVDLQAVSVMLATWSAAAAQMTKGLPVGAVETVPSRPPIDTGEAMGLSASNLTITVGFGPSFFDDRFGLADKRPAALADIPELPGDYLQASRSNGDICVQACADDPQVAFHAIRNFARLARGTAVMKWSQLGFGRTSSTSKAQDTPRNLFGFKDGTNNIKDEDTDELEKFVWVGDETDQNWMRGGSYLVARRIRMLIESWDTDFLADQEKIFGRYKESGAPLTGKHEFDTVDLTAKRKGEYVVDVNSHIRLAAPSSHGGQKLLRRGYSYTDGIDADTGLLDAGLFFIAFQKDPRKQFVPIQRMLGRSDLMNEYVRHTGSGLWACPPGVRGPGDWWGKSLFV
ncbi:Dyp-type peroxidase [Jatrophihabitans fulvus]